MPLKTNRIKFKVADCGQYLGYDRSVCLLEYPNTRLAHIHDIEFDAKYCILEHF